MTEQVQRPLAARIVAAFCADTLDLAAVKAVREERAALLIAEIKSTATEIDHKDFFITFVGEAKKSGMADSSITARKSDVRCLLEHPDLIEDGAKSIQKVARQIRAKLKPVHDRLVEEYMAAKSALESARETYELARDALAYYNEQNREAA